MTVYYYNEFLVLITKNNYWNVDTVITKQLYTDGAELGLVSVE